MYMSDRNIHIGLSSSCVNRCPNYQYSWLRDQALVMSTVMDKYSSASAGSQDSSKFEEILKGYASNAHQVCIHAHMYFSVCVYAWSCMFVCVCVCLCMFVFICMFLVPLIYLFMFVVVVFALSILDRCTTWMTTRSGSTPRAALGRTLKPRYLSMLCY